MSAVSVTQIFLTGPTLTDNEERKFQLLHAMAAAAQRDSALTLPLITEITDDRGKQLHGYHRLACEPLDCHTLGGIYWRLSIIIFFAMLSKPMRARATKYSRG